MASGGKQWDPLNSPDWDAQSDNVKRPAINRMLSDIKDIRDGTFDLPSGIWLEEMEDEITNMHVLMHGPSETPYEGGFFHFFLRFPPNFPMQPPRVKLLTTGDETVRFNPNIYDNGMVCLSITGTWGNSTWVPAQRLGTVLKEIYAVLIKNPYYLEPIRNNLKGMRPKENRICNEYLTHETLRVAVCQMLENPHASLPDSLRKKTKELFLQNYDRYLRTVKENMHLTGQPMQILRFELKDAGVKFEYENIKKRLQDIHAKLTSTDMSEID